MNLQDILLDFKLFIQKKILHLNSFFTGGFERAVGALEAKRHCLGFHPATAVKIILSFFLFFYDF